MTPSMRGCTQRSSVQLCQSVTSPCLRRARRRHGAESHPFAPIRLALDNITVFLFILPCIPDLSARQPVQLAHRHLTDRHACTAFVDELQGIAISAHLFLIAILKLRLRRKPRIAQPRRIDRHTFDTIGSNHTFS